jgi:CRP-like cAMP-binding protein
VRLLATAREEKDGVILLPRGGSLLPSSLGYIQYGAVPETIKDTMEMPGGVPRIFIVPPRLFAPDRGMNLAELEFPAYWNFFIKGQRTTIICRRGQREILTRVLSEAVFGPRVPDPREFSGDVPAGRPDLIRELAHFRLNPVTGRPMELSDLVEFIEFGEDQRAYLPEKVIVQLTDDGGVAVIEGGRIRARVRGEPPLPPLPLRAEANKPFRPPVLGVTVIGSGHGFDPGNRTSGFLLWIDGRGVMVDPPVDAIDWLAGYDLDPRQIDSLILTHCHADHDAGALQKIVQEGRITVYTTHTVLSSFVAKYSQLTGMDTAAFRRLFDHVPVRTGEPMTIHGASFTFNYSLHSIPCMGFEVTFRGKGLVYPSDTLNDPQAIQRLEEQKVLTPDRSKALLEFPWHHHLILHEAGIPPIHTPVSYLASLDEWTKSRLMLVHVSARTLPENSGLQVAPTGLENTVDLKAPQLPVDTALEVLDAMARVTVLADLPVARAAEFLRNVRKDHYRAGTRIVAKGTPPDKFNIVLSGHCVIYRRGRIYKTFSDFDVFGEITSLTGAKRQHDIWAKTDVTLLALDCADFVRLLRGTDVPQKLIRFAELRKLPSWELLKSSAVLSSLTPNQMTQLQQLMEPVELTKGAKLGGDPIIVSTGRIGVRRGRMRLTDIVKGGFAGDARRVRSGSKSPCSFICETNVSGFRIRAKMLRAFFRKNPGVYLKLANLEPSE